MAHTLVTFASYCPDIARCIFSQLSASELLGFGLICKVRRMSGFEMCKSKKSLCAITRSLDCWNVHARHRSNLTNSFSEGLAEEKYPSKKTVLSVIRNYICYSKVNL